MTELLSGFEFLSQYARPIAFAAVVVLVLFGAAAAVHLLRNVYGPGLTVLQWLFAYKPKEKPNEFVVGIMFGARMCIWAGIISVMVWFLAQFFLKG